MAVQDLFEEIYGRSGSPEEVAVLSGMSEDQIRGVLTNSINEWNAAHAPAPAPAPERGADQQAQDSGGALSVAAPSVSSDFTQALQLLPTGRLATTQPTTTPAPAATTNTGAAVDISSAIKGIELTPTYQELESGSRIEGYSSAPIDYNGSQITAVGDVNGNLTGYQGIRQVRMDGHDGIANDYYDASGKLIKSSVDLDVGNKDTHLVREFDPSGKVTGQSMYQDTSAADLRNMALMAASFIPGVAPFAQGIRAATALSHGDILGAVTAGVPALGGLGIEIPGAAEITKYASAANALAKGDVLSAASTLTGSSDLKVASTALNAIKAIDSGNPLAVANAAMAMNDVIKSGPTTTSMNQSQEQIAMGVYNQAIRAGASEDEAMAAANAVINFSVKPTDTTGDTHLVQDNKTGDISAVETKTDASAGDTQEQTSNTLNEIADQTDTTPVDAKSVVGGLNQVAADQVATDQVATNQVPVDQTSATQVQQTAPTTGGLSQVTTPLPDVTQVDDTTTAPVTQQDTQQDTQAKQAATGLTAGSVLKQLAPIITKAATQRPVIKTSAPRTTGGLKTVSKQLTAQQLSSLKPGKPPARVDVSTLQPVRTAVRPTTTAPTKVNVSKLTPITSAARLSNIIANLNKPR